MDNSIVSRPDMTLPSGRNGFEHPTRSQVRNERRSGALAELIATAALALSTIVAATVVSIGIARASAGALLENEGGIFAVSLLLGLVFIGMGGITVLMLPRSQRE
jgi:hypothetical protein